jgi:type I restriction enzyme S subunit
VWQYKGMKMKVWKEVRLGDLCIDNKGSYGIAASAVPYSEDLYTYLRITDINNDGTLNKSDLKSVADENAEQYILQPNDIVFARTGGSTGRNYFYDGSDGVFVYAGFLIKFSIDPNKVNPKYIKYFCLSQEYKNWVYSFNTGSTRGNINAQTYANMPVILPPRSQQDLLVRTLSSLDNKIELNNKINTNLEQQAQEIYKNICQNAETQKFEDLISSIETGTRPKGGAETSGVPSIGAEKIEGLGKYDYSNEKFISHDFFSKMKRGIVLSKDVLLYKDGAYTGKSSMALNGFPHKECAVNEHVFILRTNNNFAQFFLYCTLKNPDIHKTIYNLACGKAAQPGLNQQELLTVNIPIPSKESIELFEKTVSPLMNMIAENALENRNLSILRDSLLPKLISGEIKVNKVTY